MEAYTTNPPRATETRVPVAAPVDKLLYRSRRSRGDAAWRAYDDAKRLIERHINPVDAAAWKRRDAAVDAYVEGVRL